MKYCLTLLTFLTLGMSAHAQSWNYLAYTNNPADSNHMTEGWVTLEEKNSKQVLNWYLPNMNRCYHGTMDAQVTKTAKTTSITVPALISGCVATRLVINNDGSGGYRSTFNESTGKWSRDTKERKLTPKN